MKFEQTPADTLTKFNDYDHLRSFLAILRNRYFYYGLLALFAGIAINDASQAYLHYYVGQGNTLPALPDMILDRLPVFNVSLIYDIFVIIPVILLFVYIVHDRDYNRLPFMLLMVGAFYIVRGIFIVVTPIGNPPMFIGSDSLFHGFANYELGVYPSGHVGNLFMLLLLVNNRLYKWLLGICLMVVIVALLFAHSHYSIDIFSGLIFAYAIYAFGEKHFLEFDLGRS